VWSNQIKSNIYFSNNSAIYEYNGVCSIIMRYITRLLIKGYWGGGVWLIGEGGQDTRPGLLFAPWAHQKASIVNKILASTEKSIWKEFDQCERCECASFTVFIAFASGNGKIRSRFVWTCGTSFYS
jgi:hypothetical protein